MTFAEKMKILLKYKNASQDMLAKHVGVSQSQISSYGRGESIRGMGAERLIKICNFFGVDPEWMFDDQQRMLTQQEFDDHVALRKMITLLGPTRCFRRVAKIEGEDEGGMVAEKASDPVMTTPGPVVTRGRKPKGSSTPGERARGG